MPGRIAKAQGSAHGLGNGFSSFDEGPYGSDQFNWRIEGYVMDGIRSRPCDSWEFLVQAVHDIRCEMIGSCSPDENDRDIWGGIWKIVQDLIKMARLSAWTGVSSGHPPVLISSRHSGEPSSVTRVGAALKVAPTPAWDHWAAVCAACKSTSLRKVITATLLARK